MPPDLGLLSWLHIGDLHIVAAGEPNHRDLQRIVALANDLPPGTLDFAFLPGDNADDGTPEQFALVRDALALLRLPTHILPGDHDFKPGSLDAFHRVLGAEALPKAIDIQGHRCLFLDVVSTGTGGPDFRLGTAQLDWLECELDQAHSAIVFMHTYPADLREGGERLGTLLARPHVRCVDMGHTHYNELANDGGTIFMATRSTGQIEEGPAGFSIAAIDGGCISWRFKPLDYAWPFVLVTSPADRRLVTAPNQHSAAALVVRAKVAGDAPIERVEMSVNEGGWVPMHPERDQVCTWHAEISGRAEISGEPATIRVRVKDALGRHDQDRIEPCLSNWTAPKRSADGSDRNSVDAWPEKGIFTTQLGPNRNGRKW